MKKTITTLTLSMLFVSVSSGQSAKEFLNAFTGGEKVALTKPFENPCGGISKGRLAINDEKIAFSYKKGQCSRKKTFEQFDYDLGENVKIFRSVGKYMSDVSFLIGSDQNDEVWGFYTVDEEGHYYEDPNDFKSISFQFAIGDPDKIKNYDTSVASKYNEIILDNWTKMHSVSFEKTDFADDHGISGKYFMSQTMSYDLDKVKYSDVVYLDFDPETYKINVHHGDGIITEGGMRKEIRQGADDKKSYTWGLGFKYETSKFFSTQNIMRLEKDLFIVDPTWSTKSDIPYSKQEGGEKVLLLGKDKALLKELAEDTAKLREMIVAAATDYLHYFELTNMKKYPLPKIGNTDKQLRAEARHAIESRAASYGWKETILNAYVISNDWTVKVNALGTPTKRLMDCVVIMRNEKTGKCKWEGFTIAQNYQGNNSYGNTYCNGNSQRITTIDCSEANKY